MKDPRNQLYRVWCGQAMGAFNDWMRGSYLEKPENCKVTEVARRIITGAAVLSRVGTFGQYVEQLPPKMQVYVPKTKKRKLGILKHRSTERGAVFFVPTVFLSPGAV